MNDQAPTQAQPITANPRQSWDTNGDPRARDTSRDIVIRIAHDDKITPVEWIKLRNELTAHVVRRLEKLGRADLLQL